MLNFIAGGVCAAQGFRAGGIHVGVKTHAAWKKDVALIVSDVDCACAAVYTKNAVKAAHIHVDKRHLADGKARAAVINSGNANACAPNGEENAEKVCAAFGLHIPIFGMVKDDRHRTRALTTAEGHEIDLHADPAVFALIGQIQEETHRFAITYHHESHTRSSVASALDGIPNIGEVRKRKLLARFKSVKAIREAELPALQSELGRAAGRAVYDHFHPKEETP